MKTVPNIFRDHEFSGLSGKLNAITLSTSPNILAGPPPAWLHSWDPQDLPLPLNRHRTGYWQLWPAAARVGKFGHAACTASEPRLVCGSRSRLRFRFWLFRGVGTPPRPALGWHKMASKPPTATGPAWQLALLQSPFGLLDRQVVRASSPLC